MVLKIGTADFEEILPVWSTQLWPNRVSDIKTHSSIPYLGGCDMTIYNSPSTFWKVTYDSQIIGVNSGFKTSNDHYRSRGIWIDPLYRKQGISTILFEVLFSQAIKEDCKYAWSIPRITAIQAYEKAGFKRTSDWFDEGMEFGPNCYVLKDLK